MSILRIMPFLAVAALSSASDVRACPVAIDRRLLRGSDDDRPLTPEQIDARDHYRTRRSRIRGGSDGRAGSFSSHAKRT